MLFPKGQSTDVLSVITNELYSRLETKRQKLELWFLIATKRCPIIGTQKARKSFQKYYCLQGVPEGPSFKKYDFYDKNNCFPAPIFKLQLLDCRAMTFWKVLLKLKKMTYYLSIYVYIW